MKSVQKDLRMITMAVANLTSIAIQIVIFVLLVLIEMTMIIIVLNVLITVDLVMTQLAILALEDFTKIKVFVKNALNLVRYVIAPNHAQDVPMVFI